MVALCKAPTKSAGIGLPITAICKNAGVKTLGQKRREKNAGETFAEIIHYAYVIVKMMS